MTAQLEHSRSLPQLQRVIADPVDLAAAEGPSIDGITELFWVVLARTHDQPIAVALGDRDRVVGEPIELAAAARLLDEVVSGGACVPFSVTLVQEPVKLPGLAGDVHGAPVAAKHSRNEGRRKPDGQLSLGRGHEPSIERPGH